MYILSLRYECIRIVKAPESYRRDREWRGCEMHDKHKNAFVFFNPRPVGEPVNSYVFRIEPQRETDYSAVQRLIRESAERITAKKPEE
jgi:hypothetical protein